MPGLDHFIDIELQESLRPRVLTRRVAIPVDGGAAGQLKRAPRFEVDEPERCEASAPAENGPERIIGEGSGSA
jgi:hypothetical protein